jgi:hypothetical protein
MDRITTGLLAEFSREHQIEHLEEDKRFEHFAAFLTCNKHCGEHFDTDDVVTGVDDQLGIDAIGIIVNGTLVADPDEVQELISTNEYLEATFVFVQAKRSPGFEAAEIGNFGDGVRDFFSANPQLPRNPAEQAASDTAEAIYQNSGKMTRGRPTCRLYYVTTGTWGGEPHLVSRARRVVDDLTGLNQFEEVRFEALGANDIRSLYLQSRNKVQCDFVFTDQTALPDMPGVTQAYLGLLKAKTFLSLIQDETGSMLRGIFYDNVRDFQDYNAVNSEIAETLRSDQRSRFALMNNGVTVIARTLIVTGHRFHIEDYQIVNGCQTSHVLHDCQDLLDDSVMIPLRLIATTDDDVTASIVKATNRQTEVPEDQLLALGEFQKRLEVFFEVQTDPCRLYYERRSRQYNSMTDVEKTRIVTPANLIRAYAAMFREEPHSTTRNYRGLRDKVGDDIFAANHKLEPYYLSALALYRLEFLFRNRQLDAKFKPARFHLLLAARLLATEQDPPPPNANEMVRYCTGLTGAFDTPAKAEALFGEAARVVEAVAAGNYDRDRIRTQPFTAEVRRVAKDMARRQA